MKTSGIDWNYYHPLDREIWMPVVVLINRNKNIGRNNPKLIMEIMENAKKLEDGKVQGNNSTEHRR